MADPERLLTVVALALGRAEFERRGKPEHVQPRHFEDAREVLQDLSFALHTQGIGARVAVLNTVSDLLSEAVDAPGPDRSTSSGKQSGGAPS